MVVTNRLSLNYSLLFLYLSECKLRHTNIQIQTNIQENWSIFPYVFSQIFTLLPSYLNGESEKTNLGGTNGLSDYNYTP